MPGECKRLRIRRYALHFCYPASFVSELKRREGSLTFVAFAATLSILPAVGRRSAVRAFGNRESLYVMLILHAVPNYEPANTGGVAGAEPV